MDPQQAPPHPEDADQHDLSLVRWMLSLTPAQRLAELESRLAFIHAARRHVTQLSDDPGSAAAPRG
ncbi:hypothetical protein M0G41_04490 [Lysobacter sp. CAU 1642]|uniref:Uncharacterized protein n=1 Tax=Pseudomarimonas salicorniae TaxID=2933270 RepID=A0ABT0GEF1_9GAMM|nr:hypothetical protein [Lysobacter sp. CAU 1642]